MKTNKRSYFLNVDKYVHKVDNFYNTITHQLLTKMFHVKHSGTNTTGKRKCFTLNTPNQSCPIVSCETQNMQKPFIKRNLQNSSNTSKQTRIQQPGFT